MIDSIIAVIGEYVPLSGDGIASINPVWVVSAILVIMSVWFIYKMIIKVFEWLLK